MRLFHGRNHKERSQLANRARLGILEKHKDYVQRARDYHAKQNHLNRLRQKAADRNKDEFYFSMVREKTRGGVHWKDRGNKSLPTDIVKVLKTQDENYVRTMRASNQKKIDRLKAHLTALADLIKPLTEDEAHEQLDEAEWKILSHAKIISLPSQTSKMGAGHIIFVDDDEEAQEYVKKHAAQLTTQTADEPEQQPTDLGWKLSPDEKAKKKRKKKVPTNESVVEPSPTTEDAKGHRSRLLKELAARLVRDTQFRYAAREFEMQRLLMGKGARRKLKGIEKVEGDVQDSEEDQDELDARGGRPSKHGQKAVDETTWKPRVYKWKLERKR